MGNPMKLRLGFAYNDERRHITCAVTDPALDRVEELWGTEVYAVPCADLEALVADYMHACQTIGLLTGGNDEDTSDAFLRDHNLEVRDE